MSWGLPAPARVREITPDGKFAYVEGQHGAVSRAELIRESAPNVQQSANTNQGHQAQPPLSKIYMLEYVVPLSQGAKAVFQWPSSLTKEDVDDLRDSLKIVERKISRSVDKPNESKEAAE